MRTRRGNQAKIIALVAALATVLAGCAGVVDGKPAVANAPNANLDVQGENGGSFDTTVQNALSDIMDFWKQEFPKIANGQSLTPLKGGLYSVDGAQAAATHQVPGPAGSEACIAKDPTFIIDNGAFCVLDDSIAWDRAPTHLFAQLADKYGPFMVAMIFAHEFGHSISYRLGIFDKHLPTIDTESQADCAAGAWTAWALKGQAPHFRDVTPQKVDDALEGFLDGRDATPGTPEDVSHGNGFDRLSAVADGIDKGAAYCFSSGYFASRTFTERPFNNPADYAAGGNAPLSEILDPSSDNGFVQDLNRYWTGAAKAVGKTFEPVKITQAAHPACEPAASFGYCPSDNTVYYNTSFAQSVYNSLPGVDIEDSGAVKLTDNQPADFALGVLFSIGWGLAVRHQLFNGSVTDKAALLAAACYSGSYAKDINVAAPTHGQIIVLSPSDLDEATSSMIDQVEKPQAFGARGTTGLDRIQSFVTGYRDGLSGC